MRLTKKNVSIIADIYDRLTSVWGDIKDINELIDALNDYGARDIADLRDSINGLDRRSAMLYLKVVDLRAEITEVDKFAKEAVNRAGEILDTLEERV